MDCEYCAGMGFITEATVKCVECDAWVCDAHAICKDASHYYCPDCCEFKTIEEDAAVADGREEPD